MFILRVTSFINPLTVYQTIRHTLRTYTPIWRIWPHLPQHSHRNWLCKNCTHLSNSSHNRVFSSVSNNKTHKMVDPQRVVSYEDMLKVIHRPEKVIIDVRNPDEVNSTGKIPSSINIPLSTMSDALTSMSDEEFKKQFQRPKPSSSDELIFYCQSGRRSTEALDKALKLGYAKSKTYLGSWNDWSSRQK